MTGIQLSAKQTADFELLANGGFAPLTGFQGSAVVSTDQPIAALLAKDVTRGAAYAIGGSTMTTGAGSHRLFLPLTMKRDGAGGPDARAILQRAVRGRGWAQWRRRR